jgi:hypothetical protein
VIYGFGGVDNISGLGGGHDHIYGGQGDDELYAVSPNKVVDIYGGHATIDGGVDRDIIVGADGDDDLSGQEGADYINGAQGVDVIAGGDGEDRIYGAGGNDEAMDVKARDRFGGLFPGKNSDTVYGGPGDDRIVAAVPLDEGAKDIIYGEDGNDLIEVESQPAAKDVVYCGGGYDRVIVDSSDQVSSDCEWVKTLKQVTQQHSDAFQRHEAGVTALEKHMSVGSDGQLKLDREAFAQENVDPTTRGQLERSLDATNRKIAAGTIEASDVFPRSAVKSHAVGKRNNVTAQDCTGESGNFSDASGSYYYLDSCQVDDLSYFLNSGLAGLALALTPYTGGFAAAVYSGIVGIGGNGILELGGDNGLVVFQPASGEGATISSQ